MSLLVTDAANTTPTTWPAESTTGPPELPGRIRPAQRQHVADHGAPAVDVGRAQALVGPDPAGLHVVGAVLREAEDGHARRRRVASVANRSGRTLPVGTAITATSTCGL